MLHSTENLSDGCLMLRMEDYAEQILNDLHSGECEDWDEIESKLNWYYEAKSELEKRGFKPKLAVAYKQ